MEGWWVRCGDWACEPQEGLSGYGFLISEIPHVMLP